MGALAVGLATLLFAPVPAASSTFAIVDPDLWAAATPPAGPVGSTLAPESATEPGVTIDELGNRWIDLWIVGRNVSPDAVRALGGIPGTIVDEVMSASVPASAIAALAQVPGIEYLQVARPLDPQTDVSIAEIHSDDLWQGSPPTFPAAGQTGLNVIIGVVDTGLDFTHDDFRTASGSRVRWLWDQTFTSTFPKPPGYNYGSEFTKANIDAGQCTSKDFDGHGTLITGIAAGNGRGKGLGVLYKYMGVAPEAEFVIVKVSGGFDTRVLDAVNYIFTKAASLGRPAVVLLPMARKTGPHDGTDALDVSLSNLTGNGKLIVVPAGNFGNGSQHAEWTSTAANQTGDMKVTWGAYTPSAYGSDIVRTESWYPLTANYQISVITPGSQTVGPINRGDSVVVQTPSGFVSITNGRFSTSGGYRVDVAFSRGSTSYPVLASGTWTVRCKSQSSGTSRVDSWLTFASVSGATPVFSAMATEKRLVGSPATGNKIVSVGSYSTKRQWVSISGSTYSFSGAVVGELAPYSSPGPRRDGVIAPLVAAPGYGVVGAKSKDASISSTYIVSTNNHWIGSGTSVAAAHVAGLAAQLLENEPQMSADTFRSRVQSYACTDNYTTSTVPNDRWGYGKLRAIDMASCAGTVGIEDLAAPRGIAFRSVYPNPASGPIHFEVSFTSPIPNPDGSPARLRILDVRGRQIAVLRFSPSAGSQRVTWNGLSDDGSVVPPGLLFARFEFRGEAISHRLLRVE